MLKTYSHEGKILEAHKGGRLTRHAQYLVNTRDATTEFSQSCRYILLTHGYLAALLYAS